jgi:phasin family protein
MQRSASARGSYIGVKSTLRVYPAAQFASIKEKQMSQSPHIDTAQSETVHSPLQSGLTSSIGALQQMTEQLSQAWGFTGHRAEEMGQRSSQNIEAVSQASTILTKGGQDVSREWIELIQRRLVKNLGAMSSLAGCRSLQDLVTVHTEIARDRFGQAMESTRRIAEIAVRVTDEAARVIQSQAGRNAAEFPANVIPVRRDT